MKSTHFGDPCIHCGTPFEKIEVGPCNGDPAKAKPLAYVGLGVRWDGYESFRIRWSDGRITEQTNHISAHAPYYHFGKSNELIQPPRYDKRLLHEHV
jgi:hypothetical protein